MAEVRGPSTHATNSVKAVKGTNTDVPHFDSGKSKIWLFVLQVWPSPAPVKFEARFAGFLTHHVLAINS